MECQGFKQLLKGYFQNHYMESLAEVMLKVEGGGAMAVWTSSGLTEPDKQAIMNKESKVSCRPLETYCIISHEY
jgi:hypothetical protein